jgi:hypothetical protein
MVEYGRMRQTGNEECTSLPGSGEEARNAAEQETAPRETGEESPFVTLERRTKQMPRNNIERGSLQTPVPSWAGLGIGRLTKTGIGRTPTIGLAPEGTSGAPARGTAWAEVAPVMVYE